MNNILPALYKYLFTYKKLSLFGIGSFRVEEQPAEIFFTEKQLQAPQYKFSFDENSYPNNNQFVSFLSEQLGADKIIAAKLYNDEMQQLKKQLTEKGQLKLPGIGLLQNENGGKIYFLSDKKAWELSMPTLTAERVIRRHSMHTIRVGEEQVTNKQMEETLAYETTGETNHNQWWIYALILAAIAIAVIIYYVAVTTNK